MASPLGFVWVLRGFPVGPLRDSLFTSNGFPRGLQRVQDNEVSVVLGIFGRISVAGNIDPVAPPLRNLG